MRPFLLCRPTAPEDYVEVDLLEHEPPRRHPWLPDPAPDAAWLGRVRLNFDTSEELSDTIVALEVRLPEPITPRTMSRFPWQQVFVAGRAHHRAQHVNSVRAWKEAADARTGERKPPGRPPLGIGHYLTVASRYQEFLTQGEAAPIKRIAEYYDCPRNTAASWVRRARQLGYLQPARPGRAG